MAVYEPSKKRMKLVHDKECRSPLWILPEELFFHILSLVPARDIGNFALTSRQFRDRVLAWTETKTGLMHISAHQTFKCVDNETQFSAWIKLNKNFGVFAKRLTMLYGTGTRILHLDAWLQRFRLQCLGEPVVTNEWNCLIHMTGLATALSTFSAGWDESEFNAVIDIIDTRFGLRGKMRFFLNDETETNEELESDLRIILRSFYWDQGMMNGSFLSHLFQTYFPCNDKEIARLLYLMVGPSCLSSHLSGIHYQDMTAFQRTVICRRIYHPEWTICEEEMPASFAEAKELLEDLGQALASLYSADRLPRKRLLNIIDHIFGIEDGNDPNWFLDNMATLLLFSSGSLIKAYLSHFKANRNKPVVTDLVVAMIVVCDKMDNYFNPPDKPGVSTVIDWMFTSFPKQEKRGLFNDFWNEISDRCAEEDLSGTMLEQLGIHVCVAAYANTPFDADEEE